MTDTTYKYSIQLDMMIEETIEYDLTTIKMEITPNNLAANQCMLDINPEMRYVGLHIPTLWAEYPDCFKKKVSEHHENYLMMGLLNSHQSIHSKFDYNDRKDIVFLIIAVGVGAVITWYFSKIHNKKDPKYDMNW